MGRFWLFGLAICLMNAGCAGRSIEGQLRGPLPGIASGEECRIRLAAGSAFEYACPASKKKGLGRYSFSADTLELQFERVAEEGRVSNEQVPSFRARVSGPGNEIELSPLDGGARVTWKREGL